MFILCKYSIINKYKIIDFSLLSYKSLHLIYFCCCCCCCCCCFFRYGILFQQFIMFWSMEMLFISNKQWSCCTLWWNINISQCDENLNIQRWINQCCFCSWTISNMATIWIVENLVSNWMVAHCWGILRYLLSPVVVDYHTLFQ